MNKYLEQLVELSNIDKDIDDFTPRLEKVRSGYERDRAKKSKISNKRAHSRI